MTAFKTASQAITNRLVANWDTTPIVLPNSGFVPTTDTPFVSLQIDFSTASQIAFGSPLQRHRMNGVISIEILTPVNEGAGLGLTYADTIAAIFRAQQFSGVLCFAPSIASQQQVKHETSEFWNTPLLCPFWFDQSF